MKYQENKKLYAWLPMKKENVFTENIVEISNNDLDLILGSLMTSDRLKACFFTNPNILVTLSGIVSHIKTTFHPSVNRGGILSLQDLEKIKDNSNQEIAEVITDFMVVFYNTIKTIKEKNYTVDELYSPINFLCSQKSQRKQHLENIKNQLVIGEINQRVIESSISNKQKEL